MGLFKGMIKTAVKNKLQAHGIDYDEDKLNGIFSDDAKFKKATQLYTENKDSMSLEELYDLIDNEID